MSDYPYVLDANLLVHFGERGELRYEHLEDRPYESKLNAGLGYIDEDGTPVLVIHPNLGQRISLESDDADEWLRVFDLFPRWNASEVYRWERAPGPWSDPFDKTEDIEVMSGVE